MLTLVHFWFESICDGFNRVSDRLSLIAELVELLLVRHEIRQVQFLVLALNLRAHVDSEALREGAKVNITLRLRVEYISHERGHFTFSHIYLIGKKVLLKVLVGDKTIAVLIKLSKDMVHLVFSIENAVFNLPHHVSKPASLSLVFSASQDGRLNII